MARQIIVEIVGDSKKFQKATADATSETGKWGKSFDLTKGLIVAGAGIITGAVIGIGKQVFELGAKYESMDQKAQTVFGDSLGTVKAWADANATAMGLTSREATSLATNMADLLIPMGFTRDAAAEMATNTTDLAGALSEWSNGTRSATEVSDILTKAMLGERDGLKSLGISITEADVQQQLMLDGTNKLTGAALEQAKAIATQELIMNKSKDAQTAYAEGGNKGARSQAEFNAAINTVKETLVTSLYPILKTVAKWLAENLPGAIASAKAGFEKIRPVIETIINVISKVSSVVIPALQTAVTVLGNVLGAVFGTIGKVATTIFTGITTAFQNVINFFSGAPAKIGNAVKGMWDGIWGGFKSVINSIIRGWNSLKFTVPSIDLGPLGTVGGFTLGTPDIPYLHTGGTVPGVGGENVLTMLQAGERVLPRGAIGSDSPKVQIVINGNIYGISGVDELTDKIAERLRLQGA